LWRVNFEFDCSTVATTFIDHGTFFSVGSTGCFTMANVRFLQRRMHSVAS
jgi:hypothetical protein